MDWRRRKKQGQVGRGEHGSRGGGLPESGEDREGEEVSLGRGEGGGSCDGRVTSDMTLN